jgi:shikimate kinase|tara:strand:- start:7034 stop:7543 length:510 start_codon:yes stop_codon:yes gene_type:complete
MNNIVLMGYRGTGKTAVAEELGEKLNKKIISIDKEIEKKTGSIKDYVEKNGWDAFRDIESQIIENIKTENAIIDCGGGFIEREINIQNLKANGVIIWLKASVPIIKERIKDNEDRPSLTGEQSFTDEIEGVLEKRNPTYKKAADYEIDTDNKSIEEIAGEIIKIIENEN